MNRPIQWVHAISILSTAAIVGASACTGPSDLPQAQPPPDSQMLASAVRLYRASRNDIGLYRDRLRFDGAHEGPASMATTGMGLISLCVGNRLDIIENAADLAKTTVRTLLGMEHARNESGFYFHFVDMESGARAGTSEYSTIDTAILMSGALFVASCLPGYDELDSLVIRLWDSIDWPQAVASPETGGLYLEMLDDGSGKPGSITLPFNEYMLVAWLAKLADRSGSGPATELWQRHYASADSLPTSSYSEHALLTDRPGAFLSSFVVQLPYFLCFPFTTSDRYVGFLRSAAQADRAWWRQSGALDHQWGLGAGSAVSAGYRADAIDNNPDRIVSPHIIAGFLPVDSSAIENLTAHYTVDGGAVRSIAGMDGSVLWRYSVSQPSWVPEEIQGIDYSYMMLGLAAHVFGSAFFEEHNDFEMWLAHFRKDLGTVTLRR